VQAANRTLVDGAALIAEKDPEQAAGMLKYAIHIAWFPGGRDLMADTADRLEAVGESLPGHLLPLVRLLLCLAAQAAERPRDDLQRLAELVAEAHRSRAEYPYDLALIAMVSLVTGRNSEARDLMAELVADARAQGRIALLPATLTGLAEALVFDGRHRDALAAATEALQVAHDTGRAQWNSELNGIMAYLAAINGEEERCRGLLDAVLAEPASPFTAVGNPWASWAQGVLYLSGGRPDAALDQLAAAARGPARYHASALRSIPDLVEAAVRLGKPEWVNEPMARFTTWARHADTQGTNALVERCHALLAPDENTERHYLAALRQHQPSFEQARTHLLYGAWLRRTRRKSEARTHLRAAVDYLDRIDAAPWAQLARAELAATGAVPPGPGPAGPPS
jgi:tetratricopeptide (TPR) repeat protein